MHKTLNDTFIFNYYDKNLKSNIIKFIDSADEISYEDLKDDLYEIDKRFSFSLKPQIMTDLKSGKITPIYNNSANLRMPSSIPAILTIKEGKLRCFVNLNNYATKNKEGKITIDTGKLFVLLQAGEVYALSYQYFPRIQRDTEIINYGSELYSKLFTNILNKKFAINLDENKSSQATFLTSKFFLINLLGKEPSEEIDNYALRNCQITSPYVISGVNRAINVKDYDKLETFIEALSKNIKGLEKLTVRAYLDNFINAYGPSSLFSLEFLPFFFNTVFSVIVGAFINQQYVLENLFGNTADKLYNRFVNITTN
jgi:hypothetical protein